MSAYPVRSRMPECTRMTLTEIDLLLRGAALAFAVLLAVLMLARTPPPLRWYGLGLALALFAFLTNNGALAAHWPDGVRLALRLIAIPGAYLLWALSRLMFEDRFEPRPWHAAVVAVMLGSACVHSLLQSSNPPAARGVLMLGLVLPTLGFAGHVLWRIVRDRTADLVDRRRAARLVFLAGVALLPIATVAAHIIWGLQTYRVPVGLGQAAGYLIMEAVLVGLLLDGGAPGPRPAGTGGPAHLPQPVVDPDPLEEEAQRVVDGMRHERLYRETGLTIGGLAQRLGIAEYRLRRVINRRLGHRNFNDFLNVWRLREAAERLRDPAQSRLPILTIALDLGYGSIGPFNRAFKASMGITPSEFRRGLPGAGLAEP